MRIKVEYLSHESALMMHLGMQSAPEVEILEGNALAAVMNHPTIAVSKRPRLALDDCLARYLDLRAGDVVRTRFPLPSHDGEDVTIRVVS